MTLVLGAFLDPLFDEGDLRLAEHLVELRRRHVVVGVGCQQALHHFAFLRMTWRDGRITGLTALARSVEGIEAQLALHFIFIRTVAGVTGVGEDRTDVAVELDALG